MAVRSWSNPRAEGSKDAERIFEDYGGGTIPVDPARIARALGIEILDADLDPDVAGAIRRTEGHTTIYLSEADHSNRKRFTCAHEIGHAVRRSQDPDAFEYIDYRDGASSMGFDEDERYANAFAAALLMPEKHVRHLRGLGLDEMDMARDFGVSQVAMVNRLKNLGLYR